MLTSLPTSLKILAQVNNDNKKCYMMGDFNINLLNYNSDRTVKIVLDVLVYFLFFLSNN